MAIQMRDVAAAVGDRFRLEPKIGSGGSAVVYRAEDTRNHRKVAIKVLRPELASAVADSRFEREIEVAARLTHPHILPLHDSGSTDGLSFYIMPFVEGESLRERLRREGPLPIPEAVRIGREVADALSYAHEQGVIHRDIKPGNIMLEAGHAVIADFGIAAVQRPIDPERLTDTGQAPGTLLYMSPEQIGGERHVDGRSDIYAVGCLMYEMLAGEPPFTGPTQQAIVGRKLVGEVPSLRAVREAVPEDLEQIIERMLARAPADRFKTAKEVDEALGLLGSGQLPPPEERRKSRLRRTPEQILPLLIGAVLVAAVAAAAIGFLSTTAFDYKLRIPDPYRPSRSDVLVVGSHALVPFFLFGLLTVGALVVVRQFLSRARTTITKVPKIGAPSRALDQRISQTWRRVLTRAQPSTVADTFFVIGIAVSALVVARFWNLLSTLWWASDIEALACVNRPLHHSFTMWMAPLIVGLSGTWLSVFRWARRRSVSDVRLSLARWGSLAGIVMLLLMLTIPWRLMWDATGERVRIDGERAYVVSELGDDLLLYNPERRRAERYESGVGGAIERLGVTGFFFEEPAVFESGLTECEVMTS